MKVLWIGDAVKQTGFAVVTHNICNYLCNKCDLSVFGINYDGRMRHPCNYYIYPGCVPGDIYSFDFAANLVLRENPDVAVIFNDLPIVIRYLEYIKNTISGYESNTRFVVIFPINNLPISKDDVLSLSTFGVKEILTYTNFSKSKILEINPTINVSAIYHGVDKGIFVPIDGVKEQFGLSKYFVVGNINSNSYRKRLDLFLDGFSQFAKDKDDVKCLIHSINQDISYDLPTLADDFGISDKLILSTKVLTVDKINILYNTMDVNVNTSLGEGFGLSLVEGAAAGIPILCPRHGNLFDIWGNAADYIEIERSEYMAGTLFKGSVISVDDFVAKLNLLYSDRNYLADRKKDALAAVNHTKFDWRTVSNKVFHAISSANGGRLSFVD